MQDKKYKLTLLALLAVAYIVRHAVGLSFCDIGYYDGCPAPNRLLYPFFHANFIHLACNCHALWFSLNRRLMPYTILLPFLLAAAFVASWFASADYPTVGASAIVFAMVGLNMSGCRSWRWWLLLSASLAAGFIMPGVNGIVHVAAFVPGYLTGGAILFYRRLQHDYRAVNRRK